MLPTLRSLPDPDALGAHLRELYDLDFTGCTLLRSLVNDVYELTTNDGRHVLKLYRTGGWAPDEIRWETGLSEHLRSAGLQVPRIHPLTGADLVGVLDAAEGPRPFTLSAFLDGSKPQPPFDDALYRDFGVLVAEFHQLADSYVAEFPRRPADLSHRLDEPLAQLSPFLSPAEENLLQHLAAAVRNHFAQYSGQSWGNCHGDVTLDNVLRTDDGLALLDFDLTTEGWRAADFTGVAATPNWDAFAAGYSTVRPIPDADLAAIPYLTVVARIFNLRFHLRDKPLLRGTESRTEGWADHELTALHQAAEQLL